MNTRMKVGILTAVLVLAVSATAVTTTMQTFVKATSAASEHNPNTDDPNLVGESAADLAQTPNDDTNKGSMGQHSSDDSSGGDRTEHPRSGLANALGDTEHPSEVIQCVTGVECQPGK